MFTGKQIERHGAEIVRRFALGEKPEAIGLALGVSRSTVYRALQPTYGGDKRRRPRSPGFEVAIEACGGTVGLAKRLGVVAQSISNWPYDIPLRWVLAVEKATGVPREKLRPDFFERTK